MADLDVENSNAIFEILEEWEAHLKASGYDPDENVVDELKFEEPQP